MSPTVLPTAVTRIAALMERDPDFDLWVPGIPAPQGSKKHVGRGVLVESSKKVAPWRKAVERATRAALPSDWVVLDGALIVAVDFWLPRPASHPKTKLTLPVGPPDVDKLDRGALDPLTQNGIIRDDSRIVDLDSSKRFVPTDDRHRRPGDMDEPGALYAIWRLEEVA